MQRKTIITTPPVDPAQPLRLESLESTRKRIAVSRPTIYRLVRRDPTFPRPVKIGSRTMFAVHEIDAWLQAQVAAA
jgi:prophage regulatory protein